MAQQAQPQGFRWSQWLPAAVTFVVVLLFVWPGFALGYPIWEVGEDNSGKGITYVCQDGRQVQNLSDCNRVAQPTPSPAPATTRAPAPTQAPRQGTTTTTTTGTQATAAFPKTAQEAASLFGGDASRWEPTADPGGWHLREEPFSILLNPKGSLAEGYFDTKPGKNAQCFAFVVPMGVQGATVWTEPGTRENAQKLQAKMAIPKWDDGQTHPCEVMAAP